MSSDFTRLEDRMAALEQRLQALETSVRAQQIPADLPYFFEEPPGGGILDPETTAALRRVELIPPASDEDDDEKKLLAALARVFRFEARVREWQKPYLDAITIPERHRALPIVDLGCGDGAFLTLAAERGLRTFGVEENRILVKKMRARGLDVREGRAIEYLDTLGKKSLAGVTAFQLIEHMSNRSLVRLLRLAHETLVPGGFLLVETVNPYCLESFRGFYSDWTHVRPVPKDLLEFLMRATGFGGLRTFYQHPVPVLGARSLGEWPIYYLGYALYGVKT